MSQFNARAVDLFHLGARSVWRCVVLPPLKISIIEPDPLTILDITQAFQAAFDQVSTAIHESVVEMRRAMEAGPVSDLIVIRAARDGRLPLSADDFDWLLARKVIVFDLSGEGSPPAWRLLDRPFTNDELIAAASDLLRVHKAEG